MEENSFNSSDDEPLSKIINGSSTQYEVKDYVVFNGTLIPVVHPCASAVQFDINPESQRGICNAEILLPQQLENACEYQLDSDVTPLLQSSVLNADLALPIALECQPSSDRNPQYQVAVLNDDLALPSAPECQPSSDRNPQYQVPVLDPERLLLNTPEYQLDSECHLLPQAALCNPEHLLLNVPENQTHSECNLPPQAAVFDAELPLQNDPEYQTHSDTETNSLGQKKTKKRKGLADPSEWKSTKNKRLRETGKPYLGWKRNDGSCNTNDVQRPSKAIGPTCTSQTCQNSKLRNCNKISEDQRKEIFDLYWALTWPEKKMFVINLIDRSKQKRTAKPTEESRRSMSLHYHLKVNEEKLQVCKKMFQNTLAIGEWTIQNWIKKSTNGMTRPLTDAEKERKQRGQDKKNAKEFLDKFIDSLPKLPSHYCRKTTKKLYLEPVKGGIIEIYREYSRVCQEKSQKKLSRSMFDKVIKLKNIGIQNPKKDQCDICVSYKVNQVTVERYNKHQENKTLAREKKEWDKKQAQEKKCIVLQQDVQAVKVCPYIRASCAYYKRKLITHNFTIYDVASKKVRCYWFSEVQADCRSSVFVSCLVDYLEQFSHDNLPIIIWSDGCTYQNRNAIMANGLLNFAVKNNVIIYQKYLEPGHTQMEVDSVHANIEKKLLKNDAIFVPSQYAEIAKTARPKQPYEVKLLTYDFFKKFDDPNLMRYDSIRPGKKVGDPCVTDIKEIMYKPDGTIHYKLQFCSEYQIIPQRPKRNVIFPVDHQRLFENELKITESKFQDLQELKSVIPIDYHSFYNNLPH